MSVINFTRRLDREDWEAPEGEQRLPEGEVFRLVVRRRHSSRGGTTMTLSYEGGDEAYSGELYWGWDLIHETSTGVTLGVRNLGGEAR